MEKFLYKLELRKEKVFGNRVNFNNGLIELYKLCYYSFYCT